MNDQTKAALERAKGEFGAFAAVEFSGDMRVLFTRAHNDRKALAAALTESLAEVERLTAKVIEQMKQKTEKWLLADDRLVECERLRGELIEAQKNNARVIDGGEQPPFTIDSEEPTDG